MRKITLGHLNISDVGKAYVNDALNNNRLSSGPYTQQFEKDFAAIHGCRDGVFCNSGTSALQISLAAMKEYFEYQNEDEVIVPATTFIATSNIVLQNNMKPVFVDVDPVTFNLDANQIEAAITSRTRVILPVHLFGLPADMHAICNIAAEHSLQVLEDSCETMFADIEGCPVGSCGVMACFSTYVAHLIVGGVGGIVTTNNAELASLCRSLMAHGRNSIYTNIDHDDDVDDELLKSIVERRYRFERIGYSYRATELEAAIAYSELERAPETIGKRRANAAYLTKKLQDLPMLQLPTIPYGFSHSFMMFPMVVQPQYNRDVLLMYLEKAGIETRHLFPLLTQPIYKRLFPNLASKFPVALNLTKRGFFIGIHQGLTTDDLDYVSDVLHAYFRGATNVR